MKAIMLSIQSKWCELIASGRKTIEVRKTRPQIETPFKCYIYATKGLLSYHIPNIGMWHYCEGQEVIGEFVCDKVEQFTVGTLRCDDIERMACLSYSEMLDYFYKPNELDGKTVKFGYAWHISELKIYDKPKELWEFFGYGECEPDPIKSHACKYMEHGNSWAGIEADCNAAYDGLKQLNRPPQSWCYVEELGE